MDPNANQKVSCIANYTYEASEPDELSLRTGDVVREVERLPGGWWRGELRGRRGMFPDNFVSVVDNDRPRSSSGVQGRCRAVFSYQPANPDELPLGVGDVLDVLGEVEEGWWQGRRSGRVGVFPSNFVVMLEPAQPLPPSFEPAPALPPKPVKELCRVLFPYQAVNEDELTLSEGDIVNVVSKDAPDRGWWRGELNGRTGLFPDNFVQLLPPVTHDTEEKKPERPPSKAPSPLYPILNKYSEKTASVQELTTQKISLHKDNTVSKETSAQSTITQTNKNDTERVTHSETTYADTADQVKKPPVPTKKSPVGGGVVGGLLSKLGKSKSVAGADKDKDKSSTVSSSASNSSGEWDKPDGAALSRAPAPAPAPAPAGAFDHVERASMLNDPRAQRAKAPRRRPPSQAFRDDAPPAMSNGHDTGAGAGATTNNNHSEKPLEKSPERDDEIKPKSRAREWEKNKVPWMEELRKAQTKKTDKVEKTERSTRSVSSSSAGSGSTDRILDVGLEEKRTSHSMEMSKSTSSISTRMTVMDSLDETTRNDVRVRSSLESRKESPAPPKEDGGRTNNAQSPTAAGRTFSSMLEEIKKPTAPAPPAVSVRTSMEVPVDRTSKVEVASDRTCKSEVLSDRTSKSEVASDRTCKSEVPSDRTCKAEVPTDRTYIVEAPSDRTAKVEDPSDRTSKVKVPSDRTSKAELVSSSSEKVEYRTAGSVAERTSYIEKAERTSVSDDRPGGGGGGRGPGSGRGQDLEALVAQLNCRITNLEKLLEAQNAKFDATIAELAARLSVETGRRAALQAELDKLAHCVTQV